MTRLFYLCSVLALVGSLALLGAQSYAAHQAKPVRSMLPVRLCTSGPRSSADRRSMSRGIENGVILATEQWQARFRAAHLALLPPLTLDDSGTSSSFDLKREEENARTCVRRHDTFGYIGPLQTPAARVSEPILNTAAMVQISPATTGILLTSRVGRAIEQPATYQHKLAYVTYYRVITTDAMQGPSDAAYLKQKLRATTYFAVDDGLTYSAGLIGIMQAYASKIGLRLIGSAHIDPTSPGRAKSSSEAIADIVVAKQPDGVLYAADSYDGVMPKFLRQKGYVGPLVSGDTILDDAYVKGAGHGAVNIFSSRAGPDISATASWFRQAYRQRFHVALEQFDALAYDAANLVLSAIYMAATHGAMKSSLYQMRAAMLPYVASVRWRGAIGVTSFDHNGDTRNRIVAMYAIRHGRWVYVGVAPKVRGVSSAG